MNAITLIWKQVLKELKLFQTKGNKEDAGEKTDKELQKTLKCHEDKYAVPLPDTALPTGREKEKEAERKQPVRLTQEVRTFLQKQYDFRYNLLTEETEYRPANKRAVPFEPVSKRELNTFCMEAHDQGISCWDKDLSRYIYSTCIPEYHPFRLYMEELPGWDGTDRLEALARRVSDNQLWIKSFHTWMLGLTAQWMGMTGIHANSVAPILVSSEQGRQKSTFCKALIPPALSRYYMDNLKLSAQGKPERLLAEMGLLNMDEFDKYGTQQMPLLKNLMQMANLNICKAYQKNFRNLPRIASFIGTSNRFDLLTDPTGSRRFICIEAEHLRVPERTLGEDGLFYVAFMRQNPSCLGAIQKPLYHYTFARSASLSNSWHPERLQDNFYLSDAVWSVVEDWGLQDSEMHRKKACYCTVRDLQLGIKNVCSGPLSAKERTDWLQKTVKLPRVENAIKNTAVKSFHSRNDRIKLLLLKLHLYRAVIWLSSQRHR